MSTLKAVGVFWDIENCCVPKGKSALKIIERIRETFFKDFREAEFICVCDINKESDATIKELNDGQINVVHINAVAKNAADDKIRQSLRRFSDSHPPGTKVILISSDVNFASDLSDLRHRKKFDVVLIHKAQVSDALLSCATEHYLYEELIRDLPDRPGVKEAKENVLVIYGYGKEGPLEKVRQVLKMLSNNCGGKVLSIGPLFAILKFDTPELLDRAKKRMNGEDVYGRKITVCLPEETPFYNTIKKLTAAHLSKRQESPSPQRRPGRERTSSRGFTPDPYDNANGSSSVVTGYSSYLTDMFYGKCSLNDSKLMTTYQQQPGPVTSLVVDGNSPSHTHTLPNSNSEKYYSTKSGPSSLENSPNVLGAASNKSSAGASSAGFVFGSSKIDSSISGGAYVMGDLSNAATSSGETITVFKPTDNRRRLADIPIPSFGFRDIPPPVMSSTVTSNSKVDTISSAFDPIKLIETTSHDNRVFLASKSSLPGPDLLIEHPEFQPPHHIFMQQRPVRGRFSSPGNRDGSTNSTLDNGFFTSSQPSAFTKHHQVLPASNYQNHQNQSHQSRSLSVPAQQESVCAERVAFGEELSAVHGYCPVGTPRSHSQNSGVFKKPAPAQKHYRNVHSPGNYQHNLNSGGRPGHSRSSSREQLKSVSSDGEDRPFSPMSNSSAGRQGFRPRLASAPPSGMVTTPPLIDRISSPLTVSQVRPHINQHGSHLYRVPTPAEIGDPSVDYHHPEFNSGHDPYVELIVSNLDYNIHPREWRKIIYATFHPHVRILSIQVRLQADHTSVATVRLPTEQDARFAISQFHRRKIGYKRINVQFKADCTQSPADSLRADTIALLMEAKENRMPLSRLIDLFDKRFHRTVSVSDVYKMRDTVQIQETGGAGRMVRLQPGIRQSPTPAHNLEDDLTEVHEQPVCPIHCPEGSVYYTEALNSCMLPSVMLLRKHFSPQLHSLLLSHNGYIPLMSFPACFAAEFQPIEPVKEGGIPLEHVISCVPGVEITVSKVGVKVIQFQENREQFYDMMKGNSWQELGKISREVMELLRQQPACTMPVSKFIPSYHHYFGRQCRVADYGYTKLQELFEAIPHAVQILGSGDRKAITLSPRSQLKRFTTDILKVVKAQPAKQVLLADFPKAFEKVMGKPLFLPHYGVCFMEDVLMDVPTTTLIVIEEDSHTLLALPQKDQTPEEVERTKQFALEVVDLLKHNPQCRMPFNKFIPAYHHHFGRQCRVADYGFTKLADLFEAILHVVEIEEDSEERMIHLTSAEMRKVLCEQLVSLIRPSGAIPVNMVLLEYAKHFGFCLKLDDFGVDSISELLLKLRNHIKIQVRDGQEYATLVKEFQIPQLGLQVMQLLMDESGGSLPVMELCIRYESKFGCECDISRIKEELSDYMQVDESEFDNGGIIRLTSQQMLGRNFRLLLLHHGCIPMNDLSNIYREQYGVELSPALYGFPNLYQLLLSFPHILEIKGRSSQKYIQSAGMLAIPDTLPPSRVDVTSPVQFTLSGTGARQETSNCVSATNSHSGASANVYATCVSDLLRHASQLWDPTMALQSVAGVAGHPFATGMSPKTSCTEIIDLVKERLDRKPVNGDGTNVHEPVAAESNARRDSALSPHGVPIAWQMKAGGEKVVSGNVGTSASHIPSNNTLISPKSKPKKKSPKAKSKNKIKILTKESTQGHPNSFHDLSLPKTVSEVKKAAGCNHSELPVFRNSSSQDGEDIFSQANPPLDTSSTHSQHSSSQYSSSSQSSLASPVKRKTRIAANFKVSL